jgi:hypothetical protein
MDDDPHRQPFAVDQDVGFAILHLLAGVVTHLGRIGIAGTSADLLDPVDTSWQVITAGEKAMADRVSRGWPHSRPGAAWCFSATPDAPICRGRA